MNTKYDFYRKILQKLKSNKAMSFPELLASMRINNYQEKSNFLEALHHLQKRGKIYNNANAHYSLFPNNTHKLDRIISTDNGLMLKEAKVLLNNSITNGRIYLDKDLVVTTNDIDDIYITKLIERDIKSFEPYLLSILEGTNLKYKQIRRLSAAKSTDKTVELHELLKKLENNGIIYQENNSYKIWPKDLSLTKLELDSKGHLFYELNGRRIYPDRDELNGAINEDLLAVTNKGKHIQKIINRDNHGVVFEVVEEDGVKTLAPVLLQGEESLKARISSMDMKHLAIGDRILINLTSNQTDGVFEADYISTIGRQDDPNIDITSLAANYGFFTEFSDEAMKEAKRLPQKVNSNDMKNRYDFTKRFKTFTIDCDNTKDMDDAVSIMKQDNGNYILAIHIADVSHYIKRGSALDKEAYQRGLSAYPANTVIPQLPHLISNGICSLNPNAKRLTKSCIIEIDSNGEIINYNFCDSVIESQKKMKYSDVNEILNNDSIPDGYENYVDDLKIMKELSDILEKKKTKDGMITFAENEYNIIEDEYGNVIDIDNKSNGDAGKIIENFMITYNYCQALYLNYTIGSSINRVHEAPDIIRIQDAREKLQEIGYELPPINTLDIPTYLQKVLNAYENCHEYQMISKTLLRAMPRAHYSPYPLGHFGLGLDYYSHSTSPIRRYPDLKAQQIIDSFHQGKFDEIESTDDLLEICNHCSDKERQADLLEKQVELVKMMDYVDRHPGKTYYGVVSDIRPERFEFETMTGIPGYITYNQNENIVYSKNKKQIKNKNKVCLLKPGDLIQVEGIKSNRRELKMNADFIKNMTLHQDHQKEATVLKKAYVKQ